jgi:hypothetical protein
MPTIDTEAFTAFCELKKANPKLSIRQVALALDMAPSTAHKYFTMMPKEDAPVVQKLLDEDIDMDEFVDHRIKQYKRKKQAAIANAMLKIRMKDSSPIGLLVFGDPHVDDDHCDIESLKEHSDLTHLPGVYGVNIGDTVNNWAGRLAKLYANQGTTAAQGWKLAEWWIERTNLLFMIGGNHEGWSGSGDPMKWIAKQANVPYKAAETRVALEFPNKEVMTINARHEHPGHSMWNPAHGVMKSIQLGMRDDLTIAGHIHSSGYGVIKDPESGRVCHAVQVAAYKGRDDYAVDRGFRNNAISPCAFAIFDPHEEVGSANRVTVFFDPYRGAEYLQYLRKRTK